MSSFFLIILVLFCACAPRFPETGKPHSYPRRKHSRTRSGEYYLVKRGDSLWKISKKYGVKVEAIMRENKIVSARELKIGQNIFVPYEYANALNSSFIWPAKGKIINPFGETINGVANKGVNIKTAAGAPVKASANGRVVFCDYLKGWGQTLILEHKLSFYTIYANLKNVSTKEGRRLKRGEVMARVASSGTTKDYILHFEIRKKHLPQNPLSYLK